VANGLEALGVLREAAPFALVVSDLSMPRLDGRSLVEQLRERFPGLPLVIISANPEADRQGAALHLPILQKPVDKDALIQAIRSAAARATAVLSPDNTA
jgi:CheY-like chemotaxis protein